MKLAVCRGPGESGGIFRRFRELCRHGQQQHEIVGLLPLGDADGTLSDPVRTRVISRTRISATLLHAASIEDVIAACDGLIDGVAQALRDERVEAVIACDTDLKALSVVAACRRLGVRVTTVVAGLASIESSYEKGASLAWATLTERYCLENSDALIFPARLVAELCASRYPKLKPYRVIHNGIGEEFLHQRATSGASHFGAVMRLSAVKNPEALGRIADQLAKQGLATELVTNAGARDARRALHHLSRVRLRPPLRQTSELAAFYSSCRALVVPSRFEAYGNVAIEALASGTPAVITNQVGARELYEELGLTHLVVPVDDDDGAVERLLAATPISQKLREHVSKICGWPRVCERILAQARAPA
jgi:glycosyltransferase involved in cell wall biosynthesis